MAPIHERGMIFDIHKYDHTRFHEDNDINQKIRAYMTLFDYNIHKEIVKPSGITRNNYRAL